MITAHNVGGGKACISVCTFVCVSVCVRVSLYIYVHVVLCVPVLMYVSMCDWWMCVFYACLCSVRHALNIFLCICLLLSPCASECDSVVFMSPSIHVFIYVCVLMVFFSCGCANVDVSLFVYPCLHSHVYLSLSVYVLYVRVYVAVFSLCAIVGSIWMHFTPRVCCWQWMDKNKSLKTLSRWQRE